MKESVLFTLVNDLKTNGNEREKVLYVIVRNLHLTNRANILTKKARKNRSKVKQKRTEKSLEVGSVKGVRFRILMVRNNLFKTKKPLKKLLNTNYAKTKRGMG